MKNLNTYFKLPILDGLELFHARNHTVDFPCHTHNTYNISLILDQIYATKVTDRFLQAHKGSIVVTNPNEVHSTHCDNKIGNSFFTFYISPEVMRNANHHQPIFFDIKVINDTDLFREFYALSQNMNSINNTDEQKIIVLLKKLIGNYAQEDSSDSRQAKYFQSFLEETAFDKFSLEKAAKQFGLNKYKFIRLFKSETGLTPNNYVILKRIEHSKKLLLTHNNLLDIALEAGFYDATHFCKYFKLFTGITPTAYKNA